MPLVFASLPPCGRCEVRSSSNSPNDLTLRLLNHALSGRIRPGGRHGSLGARSAIRVGRLVYQAPSASGGSPQWPRPVRVCIELANAADVQQPSREDSRGWRWASAPRAARNSSRSPADGAAAVLAAHGASLQTEPQRDPGHARVGRHSPRSRGTRLAARVEQESGATFHSQETPGVGDVRLVSSSALAARAIGCGATGFPTRSRPRLASAIHEAVIALRGERTVRTLSGSASTAHRLRGSDAIGKRLRDLPGMAPLALALRPRALPESVELTHR